MKHNHFTALWLSGFIILMFLIQQIPNVQGELILDTRLVNERPYTMITAIFLHSGMGHLLNNLLGLALFGSILEHIIGTRRFLWVFFIAGLVASMASVPFYTRVLGASGAIYGAMGMLAILRPKMVVWVYYMPLPMILALFAWAGTDLLGIFIPTGTANFAHLGGLMVGVFAGMYLRNEYKEPSRRRENIYIDERKVKEWEREF